MNFFIIQEYSVTKNKQYTKYFTLLSEMNDDKYIVEVDSTYMCLL